MKNYEAKFGTVKTGDYVVVVTDHAQASVDIEPGIVMDDGYVVLGVNKTGKARRRQIGSSGCPVCVIPKQTLTDEQLRIIDAGVQATKTNWPTRYFVVTRIIHHYISDQSYQIGDKPISSDVEVKLLKTKSLGDTTNEAIIIDYLQSKIGDLSLSPTPWRPVEIRSSWGEVTKEGYDGWNAELKNKNQNK